MTEPRYNISYPIPEKLLGSAYLNFTQYQEWYQQSVSDPESFWAERAKETLDWKSPWSKILEYDYHKAEIKWFIDAKINVAENCLDRHLEKNGSTTAIIWEGNEPGDVKKFTYQQVHTEVCKLANVLKDKGIKKGDRVAIYLPMIPELAFTMLACARIGAIHSVVFAGFSADSLKDRILDSSCKMVVTANEGLRGSKRIPLKEIVDKAVAETPCIESVLVCKRTDSQTSMTEGRDFWLSDLTGSASSDCPAEVMDSEDPLFILYTSGSTGKPKGVLHTQAGYLLYAAFTHKYVFDYKPGDIYCCAADIGWVTGHSYILYGPLANAATTMMFESIPTYPDSGRYWDLIERHKVNIFYTAPTAIRAVLKEGPELPKKYDLSSLRVLGTVGEPINEDAWQWYYETVGNKQCAIVDTWWQTETGGILISPLPGATKTKAGSATLPLFGIQPSLVDPEGKTLEGNDVRGRLCFDFPWPGQMRSVYGDHKRFFETYFSQYPGKYFSGDACYRDSDGYYWITGRVDDVLNVSGHRLGTAEVESAIVHSGKVAEAAVVGMPHEVKGVGIYAYCILLSDAGSEEECKEAIIDSVRTAIGPIAKPDVIHFVPGLPKTRSGKIMRRILRKIAAGEIDNLGDTSTLADPGIVSQILESKK